MTNPVIARWLLVSFIVAIIAGLTESDLPDFSESLFALSGLSMIISGGFAIKRLW